MNKTQETLLTLKKQGFTKWRISKRCGVTWQTVHSWERGMFEPKKGKSEILLGLINERIQ